MNNIFRHLLLGVAVLLMAQMALMAGHKEFSEYQCIVDRQMFGQPPPGFDPTKPPSEVSAKDSRARDQELSKEQEEIKSSIRFSMINQTPSGEIKVGFTDNSNPKSPASYYLKVGESSNGWTVKEADALKESMTIVKGDVEVKLDLGGDSASGAGSTKSLRSNVGGGSAFGGANRPARGLGSLSQRRLQREKEREASEAAARAEREEAARQREEEKAQRDKEREEQRAQMMQIQEELRKAREQREKEEAKKKEKDDDRGDDDGGDE